MSSLNVSTRYSKAFFNQLEGRGNLESISRDVEMVFNTLQGSKELRNLLKSPVINSDKKEMILSELFEGKISSDTKNFLNFVISKNREDLLYDILKRFLELRDIKLGLVNIEVASAVEIPQDQAVELVGKLENYTQKKVKIKYSIDEDLIGGFIAKIGDTLVDASVTNQLKVLKKQLLR